MGISSLETSSTVCPEAREPAAVNLMLTLLGKAEGPKRRGTCRKGWLELRRTAWSHQTERTENVKTEDLSPEYSAQGGLFQGVSFHATISGQIYSIRG